MAEETLKDLTPAQIVAELDKYIIGQANAKKSVAIALRNRWRRMQVPPGLREEIMPNNIIMIGTTGVGKTEIARRLAKLAAAPFIKVEASKFTEVGYVGRDVESMVRDLTDLSVSMVRLEKSTQVTEKARIATEDRLIELIVAQCPDLAVNDKMRPLKLTDPREMERYRKKLVKMLEENQLADRRLEVEIEQKNFPLVEVFANQGMEELDVSFQEAMAQMFPKRTRKRLVPIEEARHILMQEEVQKLIDMEEVITEAVHRVENAGIIFLDEIDKIVGSDGGGGPDVSREGVQRDLLPIVEGSTVPTKYGMVKTDHILFIAAGAFHVSKPSDLIPEMQGRFPIRVELNDLTAEDFMRILIEPQNALIKQYTALLATENVQIKFTDGAVKEIARIAADVNGRTENIGARRLHTVMNRLLENLLFDVPDVKYDTVTLSTKDVRAKLKDIVEDEDLSRYIL